MATPVADSIPLPTAVNNGNGSLREEFISGLVQGGSWDFGGGAHELTWSLDLAFDGPTVAWTQAWIDAVTLAFEAWAAVIDVTFVFTGTPGVQSQNQSTADLSIVLETNGGGYLGVGIFPDPDFADQTLADLGYTRNSGAFPYPKPEGDIAFNSTHVLMSNVSPGSAGFYVILHEIGHALGLKHADDDGGNGRPTFAELDLDAWQSHPRSVMVGGAFPSGTFSATPGPLDILAIQHVYGANMTYQTGNNTYAIGNGAYRTVWDAGGTDTFSAVSWSGAGGVLLDLRQGMYSGDLTGAKQTAIAYDVVIERAIGSSRADRLEGNSASNLLSGGGGNDTLAGGAGNDTLDGGAGSDTMTGGSGNDTYIVGVAGDVVTEGAGAGTDTVRSSLTYVLGANLERLVLTGGAALNGTGNTLANMLTGNSEANVLNGGAGDDTMIGGGGNDTYVVNAAGDVVTEDVGGGFDIVQASVSRVLEANLERLILTGTAAIDGTGNTLANTLTGNVGNNILNGGGGNDTMAGGGGHDTYIVNAAGDVVSEAAGAGIDTVRSSVGYTLGANVEKLVLLGAANINGTGNALNNALTGNGGNNVLNGGLGNDTLSGGGGADSLVGGAGNDLLVWDAADMKADGGAGDADVLRVLDAVLDLAGLAGTKIAGIERVDLVGPGAQTLTLTLADVLAMSPTTNVLRVDGGAGDIVDRDAGWAQGANQAIGASTYRTYTLGAATLLVDAELGIV